MIHTVDDSTLDEILETLSLAEKIIRESHGAHQEDIIRVGGKIQQIRDIIDSKHRYKFRVTVKGCDPKKFGGATSIQLDNFPTEREVEQWLADNFKMEYGWQEEYRIQRISALNDNIVLKKG